MRGAGEGGAHQPVCLVNDSKSIRLAYTYDSYWDNVGGESLDAALLHSAEKARILVRTSYLALLHDSGR